MNDDLDKKIEESRKEKFKVTVKRNYYDEREIEFSITHNGYQWSTVKFNDTELIEVIDCLQHFQISEANKKAGI